MSILRTFLLLLFGAHLAFADPAWWTQANTQIIQPGAAPNNHVVATVGQLKWVAYCAKVHLDNTLSGGAGPNINSLVASFTPQAGVPYTREQELEISQGNHSALTIGQLKAVAKVFYDRLNAAGYSTRNNLIAYGYPASWPINNPYPWDPATPTAQNYALATVGQLKLVFSFDPGQSLAAAAPMFSPDPNVVYTSAQQVSLSSQTPGATIRYTLNGTTPTMSSPVYSGPLSISSTTTIKAFASASGYANSPVSTATYTIQVGVISPPVFTPDAGTYEGGTEVSMSTATSGATIYYTLNGTTPTTASTVYTGPVPVTSTTTVKAIASLSGSNSSVTSATYTITVPPVATPTISPNGGSFTGSQQITLSTATSGAQIYYTIDGSDPTGGTLYTGPFTIDSSLTVKAISEKNGQYSAIRTAVFTRTPDTVDTTIMNEIIGANVIGQNPVLIGTPGQTASFTGGLANGLPINSGRLFSSGYNTWQGANSAPNTSYNWGRPGDAVLTSVAYGDVIDTFDVSGISFEFKPTYSNVQITYAFASEEYLEYVGAFADAMLILVDGVPVNLTPDGKLVGVGSIHPAIPAQGILAVNGHLYTDNPPNSGNLNVVYDGLTTSLTASFTVTPNVWHSIRIVVGDANDPVLDSATFIKLDSLISTP